jgi:hypothetical protein
MTMNDPSRIPDPTEAGDYFALYRDTDGYVVGMQPYDPEHGWGEFAFCGLGVQVLYWKARDGKSPGEPPEARSWRDRKAML